ncbi:hypothetical protein I4I73_10980 [Pseudonocardia sp. KRD-184]|uniref:Polysaccharide chain length determinant N-terminal domain-containing protein n=1 Tax=Pseudonocardia oceani TaxID=2792013 RepID=A0ABS6U5H7_9PSEU|nr:Wzz/FepE/Etk N-terminal domain-containing protein [Pseudonocardia oceani]MBW0089585.1 hypothetical protein [Pseudonocardia oceani]MBW0096511.1 hypothetical protein [Pseudonocardia oceani]MBW0122748.1 hypothetical protein [Pseudonocardia oceani]MBW0127475.1 hypothetical protein [Pseudonocardia oceani]
MSFVTLVRIIARRWLLVILCIVAGGAIGGVVALSRGPEYAAETQLVFGIQGQSAEGSSQDLLQQMPTYAALATTATVLDPVVRQLGSSEEVAALSKRVSAVAPDGTLILQVTATDRDPQRAAAIANAVAASYGSLVSSLPVGSLPVGLGRPEGTVAVSVVQPAAVPANSASVSPAVLILGGSFAGLVIIVVVLMLLDAVTGRPIDASSGTRSPVVP